MSWAGMAGWPVEESKAGGPGEVERATNNGLVGGLSGYTIDGPARRTAKRSDSGADIPQWEFDRGK